MVDDGYYKMTGGVIAGEEAGIGAQRLGPAGLALHYANVVNQIDNVVSSSLSFNFFFGFSLF